MGLMQFFRKYSVVKAEQAGGGIMSLIVAWDPEGASDAQIEVWSAQLDKITHQRQAALNAFTKEKKEADEAEAEFNREMKVAEKLQADLQAAQAAGDQGRIDSLNASLIKQVAKLEKMKPEVDREVQEAKEAKEVVDQWNEAAELLAEKIVTARQSAASAQRRMESAELKLKREKEKQQQAEVLAGVCSQTDKMGSAITAMEARAKELEDQAEEAKFKTQKLTQAAAKPAEEVDSNIAAARQAVEGTKPAQSLEDRLAALKK
jgi:chromosome segregation ATPase